MSKSAHLELDSLKSLIADVAEKLTRVKTFDQSEEVNLYCDDLELQVMERVESAIKHLNDMEKELLAEIDGYRNRLLNSLARSVQRQVSSSQRRLEELTKELDERKRRWEGEDGVEKASDEARDLLFKLDLFENQLKNETFLGSMMTFEANQSFCQFKHHLGKLCIRQLNWNDQLQSKTASRS